MRHDFGDHGIGGPGKWSSGGRDLPPPGRRAWRPSARTLLLLVQPAVALAVLVWAFFHQRESEWRDVPPAPAIVAPPARAAALPKSAAAEQSRACGEGPRSGEPVTPARPIGDMGEWVSSDDYPGDALRLSKTGISSVGLSIDETGRIASCQLIASSGTPSLDVAACSALQARGRYQPARDAKGCPVPWHTQQRVRWQIPAQ